VRGACAELYEHYDKFDNRWRPLILPCRLINRDACGRRRQQLQLAINCSEWQRRATSVDVLGRYDRSWSALIWPTVSPLHNWQACCDHGSRPLLAEQFNHCLQPKAESLIRQVGKGKLKRGFVLRLVVITSLRCSGMARVLKGSHSFTCTPRVHPLMEWTTSAFAFPAKAGTRLPTAEGWKAELSLGGWLVTYWNNFPAPGIESGHDRPSRY